MQGLSLPRQALIKRGKGEDHVYVCRSPGGLLSAEKADGLLLLPAALVVRHRQQVGAALPLRRLHKAVARRIICAPGVHANR